MSAPVVTAAERDIGAVALLVLLAGIAIAATMSPGTLDRESVLADAEVPEHRIVEVAERTGGRALAAHVVVEGTPDADALVAVAAAVVDRLREERRYSGLRISLYDHEGYLEIGPTLGQALDAPDGEWTQAVRSTRTYQLHRTVVEVRDKDWTQQPPERHVEEVIAWQQHAMEAASATEPPSEGEPTAVGNSEAGDREMNEALEQVYSWSVSGEVVEVVLE